MAITSADINNQRFSIDRKGYDVDEVDVFLEHVADEIDALNAQIAQLEQGAAAPMGAAGFDSEGFADIPPYDAAGIPFDSEANAEIDRLNERIAELEAALQAAEANAAPASEEGEASDAEPAAVQADLEERDARIAELEAQLAEANETIAKAEEAAAAEAEEDEEALDKDARIAELEAQIEEQLAQKEADSKAISQALLVAQRSADEIVDRAEEKAEKIVDAAKDDADEIRKSAQDEKQKILDAIADYREKRNEAQNAYKAVLEEISEDASAKLATLNSDIEYRMQMEREAARRDAQHAIQPAYTAASYGAGPARAYMPQQGTVGMQVQPAFAQNAANYVTPVSDVIAVNPSPTPGAVEKDMSGYGDTGIFDFDELD